jgi:act minimal PKS acyl carrier protein
VIPPGCRPRTSRSSPAPGPATARDLTRTPNTLTRPPRRRTAHACQGLHVDLDGEITDRRFEDLGYESLALLETLGRIENEFDISLDDSVLTGESTPAQLIDAVNASVRAAQPVA